MFIQYVYTNLYIHVAYNHMIIERMCMHARDGGEAGVEGEVRARKRQGALTKSGKGRARQLR